MASEVEKYEIFNYRIRIFEKKLRTGYVKKLRAHHCLCIVLFQSYRTLSHVSYESNDNSIIYPSKKGC